MRNDGYDIAGTEHLPGRRDIYYRGVFQGTYTGDTNGVRVHRTRSSTIINQKDRSGWRPPSSFSRTQERYTPGMPSKIVIEGVPGGPSAGYKYIYYNGALTECRKISMIMPDASQEDKAIIKALGKLKNQKINFSVCFGERKEAAEMMTDRVISIAKSIRRFKSSKPKDWLKVLKNQVGFRTLRGNGLSQALHGIPNSWLEVQYGWKPLMSDVHGAISALNDKEQDGDAYRASVSATSLIKGRRMEDVTQYNGNIYHVPVDYLYGVKVRLDYVLENPFLRTLAQLGITNPAELVWELIPYSFVVDWFVPVGNYISAWDAALGWSFKAGSNTYFARQQGSARSEPQLSYDYRGRADLIQTFAESVYQVRDVKFNRNVYSSSPLPRFPGIKNPLSSGHVANAMALLVSAFR